MANKNHLSVDITSKIDKGLQALVDYDLSIKVKFDELVSTFRFIYGLNSKIVFEL